MNFFKRLFSKKSEARQAIAFYNLGQAISSPKNYNTFAREGYAQCVIAYRCIKLIAVSCSKIPFCLYKKEKRGMRTEFDEHPLLDLLERPNPMQGQSAFMESVMGYFNIAGNSFVNAVAPSNQAPPKELWSLRPDRMKIKAGSNGLPAKYIYSVGPKDVGFEVDVLGRSPIMHMKSFNPIDDWYGMSPIEAAAAQIDSFNAGDKWNLALLQNSARPSGAIIVKRDGDADGTLTAEQREQLERQMQTRWSGSENAATPLILEGGLDWREMSVSPKDMDFMMGKNVTTKDIALAFGVPGQLVGVEGSQTYANFEQANMAFHEDIIIPLMKLFTTQMTNWLCPRFGDGLVLDIDEDAIQALEPRRRERRAQLVTVDWMSINEKREIDGYGKYEPTEDPADMIFIPAGKLPLDLAAEDYSFSPATDDEDYRSPPEDEKPPEDDESDDMDEDDEKGFEIHLDDHEKIRRKPKQNFPLHRPKPKTPSKAFNLRTASERRRFLKDQDRKRRAFERSFRTQVNAIFDKERKLLSKALDGVTPGLYEFVINNALQETTEDWHKVFKANLGAVLTDFAAPVLEIAKHCNQTPETKKAEDKFKRWVDKFLSSYVPGRVQKIQQTSKRRVTKKMREAVRDEFTEGVTIETEAPGLVDEVYDSFKRSRSTTITRTEVHAASTRASLNAADTLSLPEMQKEWVSAHDERTRTFDEGRTDHTIMDGVKMDLNEKFQVPTLTGIDLMDGPGDPDAPPDQIINCRCALVYEVPGF